MKYPSFLLHHFTEIVHDNLQKFLCAVSHKRKALAIYPVFLYVCFFWSFMACQHEIMSSQSANPFGTVPGQD